MAVCSVCNHLVKETVIEGRKLIAQLHEGPHTPAGIARYVTVLSVRCECGERIERRYENRLSRELNPA